MKVLKLTLSVFTALSLIFTSCNNSATNENEKAAEGTNQEQTSSDVNEEETAKGYKVGDEAMDFSLKGVDGNMYSLQSITEQGAKGVAVIFTCNHCPYAKKYEDRIIALNNKYKEQGYPVLAINPNDPEEEPEDSYDMMIARAKEKGFTFPYVMDEGQKVFPVYGATKTPHVYLINKENDKFIVKYIGAIDNNYKDAAAVTEKYLENAIDALIKGEEIAKTETKAIGCGIKVKS
jgi:peroxiredoxin